MNITKFETNYKRKLFFNSSKVSPKTYKESLEKQVINIYPEIEYQTILGFGGAFTESSGYSFSLLPENKKAELLNDNFSKGGLNYTLGRLPIASSDFSISSYSYTDKKDLSDFSIEKDKKFILPLINAAKRENENIKFLASPWSPPKFMKSSKMLILGGKLQDKYRKTYADYFCKYIKAYKQAGIDIEYVTVQNEPNVAQTWESCIYSPEEEADFAVNYLYPAFIDNSISTKILIWDHNKEKLFTRAIREVINNNALKAISGFAFHWYTGDHFENISLVANTFPGKLLIHTEGCTGYSHFKPEDEVFNAEIYGHDILGDLNAGVNGYIDWNLVLDNKGGPNHKRNFCNSPIMLNESQTDYIKNLSYYYIKHFSNLIQQNAKRIAFSRYTDKIEVTSFKNPDGSIVVVLLNRNGFNKEYNLCFGKHMIHDNLDAHAIVSYLIKN